MSNKKNTKKISMLMVRKFQHSNRLPGPIEDEDCATDFQAP